jgi:putative tricarboxylic transport membrane protein
MINEIYTALGMVLEFENIIGIFLGLAFGVFMGAVPGLTGTMGIALIIPLTYSMPPISAFCILLGAYKGCLYSGSIPAILLNTPGTPAAAATVLDGHPLALKGQASKAMGMALWASVIGDAISTIILIFGAVFLAQMSTQFGPAEYATLVLFSLTIVAGVSGHSLLKGIIAAGLGFVLGTVGLDPMMSTERFTFGFVTMMNGISIMVMLIGLFAVSEVLLQAENIKSKTITVLKVTSAKISFSELKSCSRTIFRSSIIGIILGAIPGLGGTPAAFLSYSEAKRKSKRPEEFGKGSLEGIAAAEAGNNATCGGALIPLLALGVPGDVTTAVLLGAFLIHGLAPGPALFTDNIELVYAIFLALLIAIFMLPIVGIMAIRAFGSIAKIPAAILYPVIAVLCTLGVYGFNSSFSDVSMMVIFGVIGYIMRKLEFPLAPLLIGFVLEPIGERSVRQALTISDGDISVFLTQPLAGAFLILTAISIVFISIKNLQKNNQ